MFYCYPYLGKWSNLTDIFHVGWNHQPVGFVFFCGFDPIKFITMKNHHLRLSFVVSVVRIPIKQPVQCLLREVISGIVPRNVTFPLRHWDAVWNIFERLELDPPKQYSYDPWDCHNYHAWKPQKSPKLRYSKNTIHGSYGIFSSLINRSFTTPQPFFRWFGPYKWLIQDMLVS